MMNEFDHIKNWANDFKTSPSDRVWDGVTNKLANHKIEHKINRFKWLAIAAVLLSVLASVLVFQYSLEKTAAPTFAYVQHEDIRPKVIEELSEEEDGLYSLTEVAHMKSSYRVQLDYKINSSKLLPKLQDIY